MNPYGHRIRQVWTDLVPDRVARMTDPETFFASLGEQIAEQVAQLTQTLTGPAPQQEPYPARVGRQTAARMQAEEIVFADHTPTPPPGPFEDETATLVDDVLATIHRASQDGQDQNGPVTG